MQSQGAYSSHLIVNWRTADGRAGQTSVHLIIHLSLPSLLLVALKIDLSYLLHNFFSFHFTKRTTRAFTWIGRRHPVAQEQGHSRRSSVSSSSFLFSFTYFWFSFLPPILTCFFCRWTLALCLLVRPFLLLREKRSVQAYLDVTLGKSCEAKETFIYMEGFVLFFSLSLSSQSTLAPSLLFAPRYINLPRYTQAMLPPTFPSFSFSSSSETKQKERRNPKLMLSLLLPPPPPSPFFPVSHSFVFFFIVFVIHRRESNLSRAPTSAFYITGGTSLSTNKMTLEYGDE